MSKFEVVKKIVNEYYRLLKNREIIKIICDVLNVSKKESKMLLRDGISWYKNEKVYL